MIQKSGRRLVFYVLPALVFFLASCLIITEIGTRSVEGGAQNPWDWQRQGPVDLTVQRKCYEAALRMVAGRTWLAGMYCRVQETALGPSNRIDFSRAS